MKIADISTHLITPNPTNRETAKPTIIQSVKDLGILHPIYVTIADETHYQVVSGNRRLASAIHFGLKKVPCVVVDNSSAAVQGVENLDREQLNPVDEATQIKRMLHEGMTPDQVKTIMNISSYQFNRRLRLLDLHEDLRNAVIDGTISQEVALEFAVIPDKKEQQEKFKDVSRYGNDINAKNVRWDIRNAGAAISEYPPTFMTMVDGDGRTCEGCPYNDHFNNGEQSLFPESDNRQTRCVNRKCFLERFSIWLDIEHVPYLGNPQFPASEWTQENRWYSSNAIAGKVVLGYDKNGDKVCLVKKQAAGAPKKDDAEAKQRRIFNAHVDKLNDILQKAALTTMPLIADRWSTISAMLNADSEETAELLNMMAFALGSVGGLMSQEICKLLYPAIYEDKDARDNFSYTHLNALTRTPWTFAYQVNNQAPMVTDLPLEQQAELFALSVFASHHATSLIHKATGSGGFSIPEFKNEIMELLATFGAESAAAWDLENQYEAAYEAMMMELYHAGNQSAKAYIEKASIVRPLEDFKDII